MADDDGLDLVDAVSSGFERTVEVVLLAVPAQREEVPNVVGPFILRVLSTPGVEQNRPHRGVFDHRRRNRNLTAVVARMRVGRRGSIVASNEETIIDIYPTEVEQGQPYFSHRSSASFRSELCEPTVRSVVQTAVLVGGCLATR